LKKAWENSAGGRRLKYLDKITLIKYQRGGFNVILKTHRVWPVLKNYPHPVLEELMGVGGAM